MSWADLAATQDGLVSRAQLLDSLTPSAVRHLLASGRLVQVRRGVYGAAGAPPTVWRPLRAALLAAPETVASHRAAAGLHHLPGVLPGAVELTAFPGSCPRLPGARIHRANTLVVDDLTTVDGFPVTTLSRTVVDMAGTVHPRLLEQMLDRSRPEDVVACVDRLGAVGRRGLRRLQPLLAVRLGGESPLEKLWLRRLRRAGLPSPVLGHQLVVGRRVLILDMAWPEHRVALEVDGWSAHGTRTQFDRDRQRDLLTTRVGWRVLRVTSRTPVHEVTTTLHQLFAQKVP